MVLEISYCLIVFSDFVPDKMAQYKIGWVVAIMIGFGLLVNLSIIVYVTALTEIRRMKFYWARVKRASNRLLRRFKDDEKVKVGDGELFKKVDEPLRAPIDGDERLESLDGRGKVAS
jgi:hypothetical protein